VGLSRSVTLFLIGLLVLIALSLHPVASVEAVVDGVFTPSRVLAELGRPFTWIGAGDVRAATEAGLAAAAAERETSRALLLSSQAAAMPRDESLVRHRALISAHVIDRPERQRDVLILRFPPDAGVAPGMPVVHGDVFVGRVRALDPRHPGECTAELVTSKEFRVGAVVVDGDKSSNLIVGGILGKVKGAPPHAAALRLLVHYPDDRTRTRGEVRVIEGASTPDARLADGFRLGTLETVVVRGVSIPVVKPEIDYEFGLDHVAIVGPPQMATAGPVLALDPFEETAWLDARIVVSGDASPTRDTRKLAIVAADGVRAGAALAVGARFVGRLESVHVTYSDARLVSDPGLSFHALAHVDGQSRPIVLGRLVSRGANSDGSVDFELSRAALNVLKPGLDVPAQVWTAGGEPDVPPGLLVGRTTLRRAADDDKNAARGDVGILRVELAQDGARLARVLVWRGLVAAEDETP